MSTLDTLRRFECELRARSMSKQQKSTLLATSGWRKISNRWRLPDGTELPFFAAVVQQLIWNAGKDEVT
jgi:hypothetical protein